MAHSAQFSFVSWYLVLHLRLLKSCILVLVSCWALSTAKVSSIKRSTSMQYPDGLFKNAGSLCIAAAAAASPGSGPVGGPSEATTGKSESVRSTKARPDAAVGGSPSHHALQPPRETEEDSVFPGHPRPVVNVPALGVEMNRRQGYTEENARRRQVIGRYRRKGPRPRIKQAHVEGKFQQADTLDAQALENAPATGELHRATKAEDIVPCFEGLAAAGQLLGLATDFDGTLVDSYVPPRSSISPAALELPSLATSGPRAPQGTDPHVRRAGQAGKNDVSADGQGGKGQAANKAARPASREAENRLEAKQIGITLASEYRAEDGSNDSAVGAAAEEISYIDTCVTLFALGRKHATNKREYDEVLRAASEAYTTGLDSVYSSSRLLRLDVDHGAEEKRRGRRRAKDDDTEAAQEILRTNSELAMRQELLDELMTAVDNYEEHMANTAATKKLLRGIPRASFETDILQAPNNIDLFKPGALQTLIRLRSLEYTVTILSHSWSSALILVTLRHALSRAIVQSRFVMRIPQPQASQDSAASRSRRRPRGLHQTATEGFVTDRRGPSRGGGAEGADDGLVDIQPLQSGESSTSGSPAASSEIYAADDADRSLLEGFAAPGTDDAEPVTEWVENVMSGVNVPGNELIFRRGVSTGEVRVRCVTLRAKRELLQKAKDNMLKEMQWHSSARRTKDAAHKGLSASAKPRLQAKTAQPARGRPPQSSLPREEASMWMVFTGDATADLPALLEADIGILVGAPSARTEAVLRAAGVTLVPLADLLKEFGRQAVTRKNQRPCERAEGATRVKSSGGDDSSYSVAEGKRPDSSDRRSPGRRARKSTGQVTAGSGRGSWPLAERKRFAYVLPGTDGGEPGMMRSTGRAVIYTTRDWREISILLLGDPSIEPNDR